MTTTKRVNSKENARFGSSLRSLKATLVVSLFLFCSSALANRPSWFPDKSCREVWKNRDLAKYDTAKDSKLTREGDLGYSNYQKRLAASGINRSSCYKDWTILVYMAADNDLHPFALWDLEEMEGKFDSGRYAGSTLKSDIVVQVDTSSGPTSKRRLHVFQREDRSYIPATSKTQYENVGLEIIRSPIVEILPKSSPSGSDLEKFLDWGMRTYPADKYMVILWGHGQGWSSGPIEPLLTPSKNSEELDHALTTLRQIPQPLASAQFGGIFNNPKSGASVSIPDLRDALESAVESTLEGRPIDMYASDACLMQMSEVLAEITPYTRFVSGSAQVQSFLGLPYRRVLYEINTGRFASTAKLTGREDEALLIAKMLPLLSEASLDPIRGQQGRADVKARETFTMSSVSSAAFEQRMLPALKDLSKSLIAYGEEDMARIFQLDSLIRSTPSYMGGGRELGSLLKLMDLSRKGDIARAGETATSKQLGKDLRTLENALDETVIERRLGTGYTVASKSVHLLGFRGVGIWVPSGPKEFEHRSQDFQFSRLHRETGWQDWLKSTFGL